MNDNIRKYLNKDGSYNPKLSELIRQSYIEKNSKKQIIVKKDNLSVNSVTRFINRLFRIKKKSIKH